MPKRIILLLDGTWNDADRGPCDTNIVRLREIIAKCLKARRTVGSGIVSPSNSKQSTSIVEGTYSVKGKALNHKVFYERGVGTNGFFDLFFGGAFGVGLDRNIRRAYIYLSETYAPGDQVFVIGFSRGSYTARSLVGLVSCAGLLKPRYCTAENISRIWAYYRTSPADRIRTASSDWTKFVYPKFKFDCLAVFDTVGALGIPIPRFWRENRDLFEFHDVSLSSSVALNLQALGVDEHRLSFEPSPWRQPQFANASSPTEQVWFPGAHSDVGGGYIAEDQRQKYGKPALDDLTLHWMISQILNVHRDFPVKIAGKDAWVKPGQNTGAASSCLAQQHEPYSGFYRFMPRALRSINNSVPKIKSWERLVAQDRHAQTINERISVSVIERLGEPIQIGNGANYYGPRNIIHLLNEANFQSNKLIPIVDYSGAILSQQKSDQLLTSARNRLRNAGLL